MVRKFQIKKHEKTEAIRIQIIPYFSVLLWENGSLFQQEPCIGWIEVSPSCHFTQPPIFLASESAIILLCFQRPQQLKNLEKKKLSTSSLHSFHNCEDILLPLVQIKEVFLHCRDPPLFSQVSCISPILAVSTLYYNFLYICLSPVPCIKVGK